MGIRNVFAAFFCVSACVLNVSAAPSHTANWTNADVGTSVTNAADWFTASNWDSESAPNDGDWKAVVLTSATGSRFIKIGQPLTIGVMSTLTFTDGSANSVNFVSDYPVAISRGNDANRWYSISGGRWFADWTSSGDNCGVGVSANAELNGRVVTPRFTLASGVSYVRLDHFATSSDPVRTNDFEVTTLYRGSAHIYMVGPRKGSAHSGTWYVTAGSPYVFRAGTTPTIAAGAVVTCGDVFPVGTFVKRIFSDTCIELSAAASNAAETGDMTLSFAAITPRTCVTITNLLMATYVSTYTSFAKLDADGDFRVEALNLTANSTSSANGPYRFCPHTTYGTYPATIVIHDAAGGGTETHSTAHANNLLAELGKCHLEFAETGREGAMPGLPDSVATTFKSAAASTVTQLTVTNGISASIGLFTNFFNKVVKDGAGTLSIGFTNDVARNTGTLVVEEGTLVLPAGSWVKTVAVSNGAALKVDGLFNPDALIVAPGARIGGTGTIVMDDATSIEGLVFEDGVKVKFKTNTGDLFVRNVPEYRVVGTPAFWVDATKTDKMTFKDDDGVNIVRVDDVRKTAEDDGYLFATNYMLYPTLAKNGDDSPHNIDFGARNASATSIEQVRDLFWSEPITNIWVIFMVQQVQTDTGRGGGQFLGSSGRLKALIGGRVSDFVRDAGGTWSSPVFHTGNTTKYQLGLINGSFYCNGILRHPFRGYPYPGSRWNINGSTARYTPLVAEAHPLLPVAADCFATDSSLWNRNGAKRLCEMLIYTNKLTQAERLAVCGYLMDKWLGCDVSCDVQTNRIASLSLANSPRGFAVESGEMLYAGSVSGDGTLGKSGGGSMYVDYLDGRSADVVVSEGVLEINSSSAPTADDLPSNGLLFRMDATRKDLMETVTDNGIERISKWYSAHDETTQWKKYALGGANASTNSAIYRANRLNGNAMLDFGTAFKLPNGTDKANSAMQYTRVTIRSVFMVQNTANGGSSLIGDFSTWSAGGIMRDGWYLGQDSSKNYILGDFSDWSNAIVINSNGRYDAMKAAGGSRTRLNGEWINPGVSGYSGGNDLVSYVSFIPITSDVYAYNNGYGSYCGGGMLGEYIAYSRGLSDHDALKVEAYLRKKWFNADTPGFTPAVASNLTVAAGATLNISGGAPMTVTGTFSGGGTVNGQLALAADAVIEVPIAANDTVQTVAVDGSVDLSHGGTVRLVGDARRLKGDYELVLCPSLTAASAGNWMIEFEGARRMSYSYNVVVVDGAFILRVVPTGTTVVFR